MKLSVILLVVGIGMVSYGSGIARGILYKNKQAIELGHAQHHPTTGKFMWKTNCFDPEK